jgi:hypothetical protein
VYFVRLGVAQFTPPTVTRKFVRCLCAFSCATSSYTAPAEYERIQVKQGVNVTVEFPDGSNNSIDTAGIGGRSVPGG